MDAGQPATEIRGAMMQQSGLLLPLRERKQKLGLAPLRKSFPSTPKGFAGLVPRPGVALAKTGVFAGEGAFSLCIKRRYVFLIILLAVQISTSPASAKTWVTDYASSHLGFTGKQEDESFNGSFKNFQAMIDFDPAKPESGKITASIDIASATAGSADRDAYLPQKDWFNASLFPKAEFATTAIKAAAKPSCFEADGTLTIKGITKPVTLPFCLTQEGDHMRAKGELILSRKDFNIGTGQWASEALVANSVTVNVYLAAK